jgi:hypothetical protein
LPSRQGRWQPSRVWVGVVSWDEGPEARTTGWTVLSASSARPGDPLTTLARFKQPTVRAPQPSTIRRRCGSDKTRHWCDSPGRHARRRVTVYPHVRTADPLGKVAPESNAEAGRPDFRRMSRFVANVVRHGPPIVRQ